jgi:predicted permease
MASPLDSLALFRQTLRRFVREPRFMVTALLTLALCIGANLTIFAVIDSALLRPLPFPAADQLVTLFNTYPRAGVERDGSSLTNYYERRGHIAAVSGFAIYREGTAIVGDASVTEREAVIRVSPDFFATLGIGPLIGRAFAEGETIPQADDVAILTDAYWRQRFNADPGVLGRSIRVDGRTRNVVGVLPPGFRFLSSEARLYFPLSSSVEQRGPNDRHSGGGGTIMIARLRPPATLTEAQSQVDAHNAAVERDNPYPQARMMADAGFRTIVAPLHADHVASIRPMLLLMQAGVLVLLLIGGVNLVNLLLIRAGGRAKEFAIRQSIGASRRHVVSDVIVETVALTVAGALLGLLVAACGISFLGALGAERLPLGAHIAFDGRLALVAVLGAIAMGIALAMPIAWFALHGKPANALQSESRGGTPSRAAQRLRHGFIVAQIALAFVLLAGAGLLGVSLQRVMAVSPGFRPDHILSGQVSLTRKNFPDAAARVAFTERLVDAMSRQAGVAAIGAITNVPLSGNSGKSAVHVKGHVVQAGESPRGHYSYGVAGDYFTVLGIPLREGRFLAGTDSRREERVCVVDEDFARYYFPRDGAIGRRVFMGSREGADAEAFTIVGVVGAVKQAALTDDQAQGAVYYPYRYRADSDLFIVTRTRVPPASLAAGLRTVVRDIDPEMPVDDLRSMDVRVADSLTARRSPALLTGIFALVALLLAAIGTYGVSSYAVAQRRHEIGIRMALGALPEQIRAQFLSLGLRLLAAGTMLGVAGAWISGRAMQSLLFDVPALHVETLAATTVIMSAVTLVACLLPSRRAARISPMDALGDRPSA